MVTILDYGINNLSSISKAVHFLGFQASVTSEVSGAKRLIIPGVGAFGAAMERLRPLQPEIKALAEDGVPILGICLGMQLLFDASEEFGDHQGLGLVPGRVRYLPTEPGLKIPHMGWNTLQFPRASVQFKGIQSQDQVYFVHSLAATCDIEDDVTAYCTHGKPFVAGVARRNVWGTQFHPEKSGHVGMQVLRNFLEC